MPEEHPLSARQLRRRKLRRWLGAGVALIAAVSITCLVAFVLTRMRPLWWDAAIDPDNRSADRAQGFEAALVTELNRVRDGARTDPKQPWMSEPWAIAMQSGDVNAWLEHTAPKWITTHQEHGAWPRELEVLRLSFESDCWRIGCLIRKGDRSQYVSVEVAPRFEEGGKLWLVARSVQIGKLKLPASLVLRRAPQILEHYFPQTLQNDPRAVRLLEVFRGQAPLAVEPSVRLADGRRVRILELKSSPQRLEIVARTERK